MDVTVKGESIFTEPPPPVADHLVCMECGSHIEHGMMHRHYLSLHDHLLGGEFERGLLDDMAKG